MQEQWGVSGDTQGLQQGQANQGRMLVELVLGSTALEYSAHEKVVEQLEGDQHLHHLVVAVVVFCWQLLFLPPPAAAAFCLAVTVSHWPCLQVGFVFGTPKM